MTDVLIAYDLDHCRMPDCRRLLPFFTRTIAAQRGQPQACWSCQRAEDEKTRGPLTQRILGPHRPPTVVRGFQPDPQGPQAA